MFYNSGECSGCHCADIAGKASFKTKTKKTMKSTEAQTVKNRRPAAGKGKTMKDTKAKLLKTAARLFASRGTEGVSTRELAGQAGVNLCAISYYFGSKQKLYEAVID